MELVFCPTDKVRLLPQRNAMPRYGVDGELVARLALPHVYYCPHCGYKTAVQPTRSVNTRVAQEKYHKYRTRLVQEEIEVRAMTTVQCPSCNHNKAYYHSLQMRSADEPETFFYECTKCHKHWREG